MELHGNDVDSFRRFLNKFCENHKGPLPEDEGLPFRLVTYYLREAEAEGECLDWALQYLTANECPPLLAAHLARTVADEATAADLSIYLEPRDKEGEHEAEDGQRGNQENEDEDDNNPQLEASKFARAVFNKVHEVCERWKKQLPKLHVPDHVHQVSVHAIKNSRRKMEDRHVMLPDLNAIFSLQDKSTQSYYAIFDGHGGVDAATYAAAHLHGNIVHQQCYHGDITEALRAGFKQTDTMFSRKARKENLRSGTTGVSIILREDQLHIAWLGDSQAMLVRDGQPIPLMTPHKPERDDERKRIEALGGCVIWFGAWRVNGTLSVSRAIGDADFKPYVSGEPDVATFNLQGNEDYIVLACDGMWDTIKPDQLPSLVYNHLQKGEKSTVAEMLVRHAKDAGSNDNISIIVVFMRDNITQPKSGKGGKVLEENGQEEESDREKEDEQKDSGNSNTKDKNGGDPKDSHSGSNSKSSGDKQSSTGKKQCNPATNNLTNHTNESSIKSGLSSNQNAARERVRAWSRGASLTSAALEQLGNANRRNILEPIQDPSQNMAYVLNGRWSLMRNKSGSNSEGLKDHKKPPWHPDKIQHVTIGGKHLKKLRGRRKVNKLNELNQHIADLCINNVGDQNNRGRTQTSGPQSVSDGASPRSSPLTLSPISSPALRRGADLYQQSTSNASTSPKATTPSSHQQNIHSLQSFAMPTSLRTPTNLKKKPPSLRTRSLSVEEKGKRQPANYWDHYNRMPSEL